MFLKTKKPVTKDFLRQHPEFIYNPSKDLYEYRFKCLSGSDFAVLDAVVGSQPGSTVLVVDIYERGTSYKFAQHYIPTSPKERSDMYKKVLKNINTRLTMIGLPSMEMVNPDEIILSDCYSQIMLMLQDLRVLKNELIRRCPKAETTTYVIKAYKNLLSCIQKY